MQKWKDLSGPGRIIFVVMTVASLTAFVFAALQLLGVWDGALKLCMPMLGLVNLCHACLQWKASRKSAYLSLGVAAFIWLVCAVVFLGK